MATPGIRCEHARDSATCAAPCLCGHACRAHTLRWRGHPARCEADGCACPRFRPRTPLRRARRRWPWRSPPSRPRVDDRIRAEPCPRAAPPLHGALPSACAVVIGPAAACGAGR